MVLIWYHKSQWLKPVGEQDLKLWGNANTLSSWIYIMLKKKKENFINRVRKFYEQHICLQVLLALQPLVVGAWCFRSLKMLQKFQLEFGQAAKCKPVQSTKCNLVNIMQRAKCKPVNIVWLFEFIKNGLFWFFRGKNDNKKPLVLVISKSSKNWWVPWKQQ